MPSQCQPRAMQCSAGELRAGSRIKEKASAVPAAARWAPALQPPARGMEWNGERARLWSCGLVAELSWAWGVRDCSSRAE